MTSNRPHLVPSRDNVPSTTGHVMDTQQSGNGGALSMVPSFKEWPIVFIHHCPIEASVCHICTNEAARKPLFIIVARIQENEDKKKRKRKNQETSLIIKTQKSSPQYSQTFPTRLPRNFPLSTSPIEIAPIPPCLQRIGRRLSVIVHWRWPIGDSSQYNAPR